MASRKIKLGRIEGVPEFRIHHWRIEKRKTKIKVYLKVDYACSDKVWDSIGKCALCAAGAVRIPSIISGGTVALPAFLAVFLPCLAARGVTLTADNIKMYIKTSRGSWHRA